MIIHQIFGLLGDTEMPELFKECQKDVLKFCQQNNYSYRLWDEKSCSRLIKKYPEFLDLYNNVKYPIMKVDIIRFIILHYYGGLYLDLDVKPGKIECLKNAKFIIGENIYNENLNKNDNIKNVKYQIEILQSCPSNNILTDYLRYVKKQIQEKDKINVYDTWKVRYVLQTTGPNAFNRFIKDYKKNIDYFTYTRKSSSNNNFNAEFYSFLSQSYMENNRMK